MLSREIRQKIIKTIQTITIKSLNDDLKENINNNLEFADICGANYAEMNSISYRVNEFFYDALLELKFQCDPDFRFYERIYISRMLGMGITMLKRFNAVKIYFVKFHFYEHRKIVYVKFSPLFYELMRLIYAKN
jgi:hypothetical protein